MTNRTKILTACVFAGSIIALFGIERFAQTPGCADTLLSESVSPGGANVAAIVERDCGATTDFATWVLLRKAGSPLRNEEGRLISVEGRAPVSMRWSDARHLVVTLPAARAFNRQNQWNDVKITYQQSERMGGGG
jgi:hypothetical protein